VKELGRIKRTWGYFLEKLGYQLVSPISPKYKGASSSQGTKANTPRKKQRLEEVEEEAPFEVPQMSEEQPAAEKLKGKGLDFETVKEKKHTHAKAKSILSQS